MLREPLSIFTGVTTIYTPRQSIHLYHLLQDFSPSAPLFPSLKTVILDVCSRIDFSTWIGFVNVLAHLQAEGRPLDRLVLMGSHLCHLRPRQETFWQVGNVQASATEKLDGYLERVRSHVGEVVDLRDEGCGCEDRSASRTVLPGRPRRLAQISA